MKIINKRFLSISLIISLLIILLLWGILAFFSPGRISIIWAIILIVVGMLLLYLSTITKYSVLAMLAIVPVLAGGSFLFIYGTRVLWRLTILGLVLLGMVGLGMLLRSYWLSRNDRKHPSLPALSLMMVSFLGLLTLSFGSIGRWFYIWPVIVILLIILFVVPYRRLLFFCKKEE